MATTRLLLSTTLLTGLVLGTLAPAHGSDSPVAPGTAVQSLESTHAALGRVVSTQPAAWTPQVRDGSVWAITQTGNTMVVGGEFTRVRAAKGGSDLTRSNVFSFDASTGSIHPFSPATDGRVSAVTPGKTPGTVYVAGSFRTLAGRTGRVFLLDAKTGQVLNSFSPATIDGPVADLALVGDRLYIGGSFTAVGGWAHSGIAALNADTGARDPFVSIQLEGHHNYLPGKDWAEAPTGTVAFDIDPDGSTMAVVGNFKTVDGRDLDQVFLLDLTGSRARLADWQTDRFDDQCSLHFDTYMRDVKWSPNGAVFSIVTTGSGIDSNSLCDSLSTWSGAARGTALQPLWIDKTGGDSLYSLAHTDSAVYYGGHQRWANNPNARDYAYFGAVPRAGLAAADPNGLVPIDWNPGRNPRGFGVTAMYANEAGVWMGSDTEWFGDFEIFRPRLGFFPTEGGRPLNRGTYPRLPGYLYRIDNASVQRQYTDGRTLDDAQAFPAGDLRESDVRGAFAVDGTLFYASSDGYLYRRPFNGSTLGPDVRIDPYNDPKWSEALTGWQDQTYRGKTPQIYAQFNRGISGMEVRDNTLYFTRPGSDRLYRTGFSPDSGIIAPFYPATSQGTTVAGSLANPGDFVFFSDSIAYVDTRTGYLMTAPMTAAGIGGSSILDSTRDYRGRGLFLGLGPNMPPSAGFSDTCSGLDCSFDASAATDPDGTLVSFEWDWGDGERGSGRATAHRFPSPGTYPVTLTVTDDRGAVATTRRTVTAQAPAPAPAPATDPTAAPRSGTAPAPSAADPPPSRTSPRSGASIRPPWKVDRIRVVKRTRTSVSMKLRPSPRAERYVFSVSRANDGRWQRRGITDSPRFTVKRLKRKTLYRIRVIARNSAGGSPPAVIRVKTR